MCSLIFTDSVLVWLPAHLRPDLRVGVRLMSNTPGEKGGLPQAAPNIDTQDLFDNPCQTAATGNTPEDQVRLHLCCCVRLVLFFKLIPCSTDLYYWVQDLGIGYCRLLLGSTGMIG